MAGLWAMVEPIARPIVAVLFNGLWQGALIALAVWAIMRAFPGANASTRYAAWSAALLAILIVPVITTQMYATAAPQSQSAQASRFVTMAPAKNVARVAPAAVATPAQHATANAPATSPAFVPLRLSAPAWLAVGLFALWGLVVLAGFARLVISLVKLESLKRDAMPLAVEYRDVMARWTGAAKGSREVRICISDEIEVPVAVGLFDAMILLPKHLLERLESHEIDKISLHELAHLRRADDWTNGLQRIAQAVLFFNPAVAFVAHQMDLEREVACDDWVLAVTGDVRPYAFCLTKMAEVTSWPHRPLLAAPGVFNTRKSISVRIERILAAKRAIGSALSPGISSVVVAALVAAFFVLRTVTPSIAYTSPEAASDRAVTLVASKSGPMPKEPSSKASAVPGHHATAASPVPSATERPPAVTPGGPRVRRVVAANVVVAPLGTKVIGAFSCTGCDLKGVKWAGRDLHGAVMEGADFSNADLHGANFSHATLTGGDFRNADLRNVSFNGANLQGCDLTGAQIDGATFDGASLTGCVLDPAKMSASQSSVLLRLCTGCNFRGADLHGRDLRGITFTGVDLSNADLRDADLSGAHLMGVDLAHARLDGAKLTNTDFTGCDFRGVDLRNVDLSHASLTGSALENAVMR